jgi:hypothetical protein
MRLKVGGFYSIWNKKNQEAFRPPVGSQGNKAALRSGYYTDTLGKHSFDITQSHYYNFIK